MPPVSFASFAYAHAGGIDPNHMSDTQLEDIFTRDSEIDYKVGKIKEIAKAYRNPGDFFDGKSAALEVAGQSAAKVYREEFKLLVAKNIPAAMAHTRATKMAKTYYELLSADVENDFPSDLNNLNLQLNYNRGEAKDNGFATPSTDIKPKGGRSKK